MVPTSTEYTKSDSVGDSRASRARRPSRVLGNSEGGAVVVVVGVEVEKVLAVMVVRALNLDCIVAFVSVSLSLSLSLAAV